MSQTKSKVRTKLDELIEETAVIKDYMLRSDDERQRQYLALLIQNARFAIEQLDHDKICKAIEALKTVNLVEVE